VYDVVESARAAAVEVARPGASIGDVHDAAVRVLTQGLVDLGVLTGPVDDLVVAAAYKPFYPHQTSHWIGLDVHDPGDYARAGASRTLAPGMVFTVEPGLYFREGLEGGERFEGIGVRIEDDVLVTAQGPENLTAALPTSADAMEALVSGARG
jgi:Xaa-Pro aminopeptidase